MNKEQLLREVGRAAENGTISRDELVASFDEHAKGGHRRSFADVLYYVGGAIVFIGIVILIWQNWRSLGDGAKILATLGMGIVAYFVALMCIRDERTVRLANAFFVISALVLPLGLFVTFALAHLSLSAAAHQTLISGILFVAFGLTTFVVRRALLQVMTTAYGIWLFFSVTELFLNSGSQFNDYRFFFYRLLIVGISLLFLGKHFTSKGERGTGNFFYTIGLTGFMGAALALGEWKPRQNIFWELIYPVLSLGALYVSVLIRNNTFLILGSLSLMVYLLKITAEYFTNSLGWPFALVLAGFLLIGTGYASFYIHRQYIKRSAA